MKCERPTSIDRAGGCEQKVDPSASTSTPDLAVVRARSSKEKAPPIRDRDQSRRTPRDGHSASEPHLSARQNEPSVGDKIPIESTSTARGDERSPVPPTHAQEMASRSPTRWNARPQDGGADSTTKPAERQRQMPHRNVRPDKMKPSVRMGLNKKPKTCSTIDASSLSPVDAEMTLMRQIREVHKDMRSSTRTIQDSRIRLVELQKKQNLDDADVQELSHRHELLLHEMERFDRLTRTVQRLVDHEVMALRKPRVVVPQEIAPSYMPNCSGYEPVIQNEMKMNHPTVIIGGTRQPGLSSNAVGGSCNPDIVRSKSEIDLTRKLCESYDMQEKLVADNADLEVKRYILYKELMTKDQNLETCRAQIKRLQGELKMMSKENAALHEIIARNCPEGDASSINFEFTNFKDTQGDASSLNDNQKEYSLDTYTISKQSLDTNCEQLVSKLESYKNSSADLESQVHSLEADISVIKDTMDQMKKSGSPCMKPSCIPVKPPMPPPKKLQPCGVCPPCPAPCTNNDPPTPAEREVAKLTIQLRSQEDNLRAKIAEVAILRADVSRMKENLDKEKTTHRETAAKLKDAETKIEAMAEHHNMMMGTKDAGAELQVNIRALKQCYREAREEVDELRVLLKEQNESLQSYRGKYMQALQTVEEQKRQLEVMDLDNNRVSDQINLEIHKIKMNFQQKMAELGPLTEALKKTQMRLDEALQANAKAEHRNETLTKDLTAARERIHILMYNMMKPPPKLTESSGRERYVECLKERVGQLCKTIDELRGQIEQQKAKVIRLEETGVVYEMRLQDKMQECAVLGGELDRMRDDAASAVQNQVERVETLKQSMNLMRTDLEQQLASGRAQLRIVEKEREELKCRMTCQIKRLRDNYDQAQLRILALTTQIATMRNAANEAAIANKGGDDADAESLDECLCGVTLQ